MAAGGGSSKSAGGSNKGGGKAKAGDAPGDHTPPGSKTGGGKGAPTTGGGKGAPTTGGMKPTPTTGKDDPVTEVVEAFTPGQVGRLAWNDSQPIDGRPILLYVFNGHLFDGDDFDYSKELEQKLFDSKEVRRLASDFVCEKICLGAHEFLREVEGREAIHAFLSATMELPEQRKVGLYLLDSSGGLISSFTAKEMRGGAPVLLREIRKATAENGRRVTAKAVAPAPSLH